MNWDTIHEASLHMTPLEWAMAELDKRRAEDARFPSEPDPSSHSWPAFAQMKRDRAGCRKARRYSRATADQMVAWAESLERKSA